MTRREMLELVVTTATATALSRMAQASVPDARRVPMPPRGPFVDHAGWIIPAGDRDVLMAAVRPRD